MINKKAKAILQIVVFALCVGIIFLLPKGDCAVSPIPPSVAKATDSVPSLHTSIDTPKTQAPIVADKPTVSKKHKQDGGESKEPAKKETSTQSPVFDLSHATFYGPVAMGPGATQINEFRGTDNYHPLPITKYQMVVDNLIRLKNNHPDMPEIEVANLSGSLATISAMDELKSILDSAGIPAKLVAPVGPGGTFDYGNSGILIKRGRKDSVLVADFFRAISPFMPGLEDQYDPTARPEHIFRIYFLGPAKYEDSGEVIIK
jgi:hypothetical protein